jgi:hypothetical protein
MDRAKKAMRASVTALEPPDQLSVIACGPQPEVLGDNLAPTEFLQLLDKLPPTHGTTELGKGLRLAAKLVSSHAADSNTVYVVSDLQRNSCRTFSFAIPQTATLKLLNFGDVLTPNLAVTHLQLIPGGSETGKASLANFSDEDATCNFRLFIDGEQSGKFQAALPAGGATNLPVSAPALTPGWHSAEVRLEAKDALGFDNSRYQTLFIPSPIRTLVVESRRTEKVFQQETFFVCSAIDPAFGMTSQAGRPANPTSALTVEQCAITDLAGKLQNRPKATSAQVIVLPGLKTVPSSLPETLLGFVKAGGGVLLFLNDSVSLNHYQSELRELLPAQLDKFENASEFDWHLFEYEQDSPVFAAFRGPGDGNLSLPRFKRRTALKPFENSSVLARFQDGMPLLVAQKLGNGRVVVANTSADTAWSDWPQRKTFVPWLHGLIQFLANSRAGGTAPGPEILAGSASELPTALSSQATQFNLIFPDGTTVKTPDSQGRLPDLNLSGIYSMRDTQGAELERLAANVPVSESDLAAMTPAEFLRQVPRSEQTNENALQSGIQSGRAGHRELWRSLLAIMLVLVLLETLLSNRT